MRAERVMTLATATPALVAAVSMNLLFSACGGPAFFPSGPITFPPDVYTTVTITDAGVTPQVVRVTATCGQTNCNLYVKFVNNDSVAHDLQSDPHPAHSTCVRFNSGIGRIDPGQSREITINGACSLVRSSAVTMTMPGWTTHVSRVKSSSNR